jgi:hypothetical protein
MVSGSLPTDTGLSITGSLGDALASRATGDLFSVRLVERRALGFNVPGMTGRVQKVSSGDRQSEN